MATVIIQERVRAEGKSYILYYKDPLNGKRKYYKSCRRKQDAQMEAHRLRALIDTGKVSEIRKTTRKHRPMTFAEVGRFCEQDWTERVTLGTLSSRTLEGYLVQLKMLNKVFGRRLMFEITDEGIREYRLAMVEGHSKVTANRRLFILKQVFKRAVAEGALQEDPALGITYLSEKEHERTRFVLPTDIDGLLAACEKTRAKHYMPAILLLAVEHAAAKQEILGLEWKHIDFEHDLIQFHRQKNDMQRLQKLMPRTREALLEWKEHLEHARKRRGITKIVSDRVFCQLDGRPKKGFKSAWGKVLEIAGVVDYHFHDNRHTYSTNLLMSGGTPRDIMEMVGHKDPAMTFRYTHVAGIRVQQLQQQLATHYANGGKGLPESGEHMGNTKGKTAGKNKKRAA
ncbi:MAG: site-specific integrase [Desulfocurvibacter africanus]